MRSFFVFSFLCCVFLQLTHAQICNLGEKRRDKEFPDLFKLATESFQMSVEYTAPDAKQTDYFTEYYDILDKKGRIDGHQAGKFLSYIYYQNSMEAWQISATTCKWMNLTDIPDMMRDDMTEWMYLPKNDADRTFGPSSMYRYALDAWKKGTDMAYMGKADNLTRGLEAQYWRRCDTPTSYVDYYFTADDVEDPMGLGMKQIPLRVFFGGKREGKAIALSVQELDILKFQPFVSPDTEPFQLPKGKGCKRGQTVDTPKRPDFSASNLQFSAEVLYRKVDNSGNNMEYWDYYSTLEMAIDVKSEHLAYYYSPWSTKRPEKEEEPSAEPPEYIIYDMKHGYAYKNNLENSSCQIIREKSFTPTYVLPNNAGELSLTDQSILFPNNELYFLSEGKTRGLKVNLFEEIIENYILNEKKGITIPNAIVSHSYLKEDEEIITKAYVEKALVQVQLLLSGRQKDVSELVIINFFGFSTQISNKRAVFNVQRCFKNDDAYSWVTLGFNADNSVLREIQNEVPDIQANILNSVTSRSELNAVRIPIVMVDIKDGLYVTMLIFGKPPIELDYLPAQVGKAITGSKETEGIKDFAACGNECLETEDNCWGFSMCGAVCTFGTSDAAKVVNKAGCSLFMRYNNDTYIPTRENMIANLKSEVEANEIKLVFPKKDGDGIIQLDCTSIEVTDPGENDEMFNLLGNKPNPRMRVVKAGGKLKTDVGRPVKNLGKLSFADCQRVCLDYKDCETLSYCLKESQKESQCVLSPKYGEDLKEEIQEDNMCNIMSRKYIDHFNRSPGNILSVSAEETIEEASEEDCARACLKSDKFQCLSFDHCQQGEKPNCRLHSVHYPNPKTREPLQVKMYSCGHYHRKFSTEFKKNPNQRTHGSSVAPISNLTLEECSVSCMEYGKGTCFGFDFCQDSLMMATTCTLLDKDPSTLKTAPSDVCATFLRSESQFAPRPYSTGYAGGIGFLCFIVGLVIGVLIVFGIAYLKVNSGR